MYPPQEAFGPPGIYYSHSAPSTPYAYQPGVLYTTPPAQSIPLPMWVPYPGYPYPTTPGHTPNHLPSISLPQDPQLIDILNSGMNMQWRNQENPRIYYDIRDDPSRAMVETNPNRSVLSHMHLKSGVTQPNISSMKIISKLFPWEIDVSSGSPNVPVTVEDLINAVHETLQKHITNPEWWIVTQDVRDRVTKSYIVNCEAPNVEKRGRRLVTKARNRKEGLRRIDWLLDNCVMKGLVKDDTFAKSRNIGEGIRDTTWVLVLGSV